MLLPSTFRSTYCHSRSDSMAKAASKMRNMVKSLSMSNVSNLTNTRNWDFQIILNSQNVTRTPYPIGPIDCDEIPSSNRKSSHNRRSALWRNGLLSSRRGSISSLVISNLGSNIASPFIRRKTISSSEVLAKDSTRVRTGLF